MKRRSEVTRRFCANSDENSREIDGFQGRENLNTNNVILKKEPPSFSIVRLSNRNVVCFNRVNRKPVRGRPFANRPGKSSTNEIRSNMIPCRFFRIAVLDRFTVYFRRNRDHRRRRCLHFLTRSYRRRCDRIAFSRVRRP